MSKLLCFGAMDARGDEMNRVTIDIDRAESGLADLPGGHDQNSTS